MEALRRRFQEARLADDARNNLIEDLLKQVDDLQKTMDRNAFALVLIDGDGMNFLDDLVKDGIAGGEIASNRLRRRVTNELRPALDYRLDEKIVIKIYANFRGLSKTYAQQGILAKPEDFNNFVVGFNKSHPLCDFIDAGNHKESADKKLQETLNLYVYNVHCKHIIFGGSTDNTYASFINSFHDIDTKRIRLLKGPPFAYEFKNILHKFETAEFPDVFRSEKIGTHSKNGYVPHDITSPTRPFIPPATNGRASSPPKTRPTSFTMEKTKSDQSGSGTSAIGAATKDQVDQALIASVLETLALTPKSCDFGIVKRKVEQKLGLPSSFWGPSDDFWYERSKKVCKWAVEEWMEKTDSPPPGNATWLLKHFPRGGSSARVLRSAPAQTWKTRGETIWQALADDCPHVAAPKEEDTPRLPTTRSFKPSYGGVRLLNEW